jgi:hypothetical protein
MNIRKFRVSAGEYRVGDYLILRGGSNWWQVRDKFDDIEQDFRSLRQSIKYALQYSKYNS